MYLVPTEIDFISLEAFMTLTSLVLLKARAAIAQFTYLSVPARYNGCSTFSGKLAFLVSVREPVCRLKKLIQCTSSSTAYGADNEAQSTTRPVRAPVDPQPLALRLSSL